MKLFDSFYNQLTSKIKVDIKMNNTPPILNTQTSEEQMKQVSFPLKNALKKILKMPYYKNYSAASGAVHNMARHEEALADILVTEGFVSYKPPKPLTHSRDSKMLENPELGAYIPNMTFMEQPFGTHNSPDFIIKYNNKFLFLEAKSSETSTSPTFNSGGVKNDYIYAFCSKKTNETTIFKGSSVITREQQRLIDQHIEEARLRDKELNDKLKELDVNHRGIQYYTRPMIIQGGGASYTNYFQHENRKETEEKVFQFVEDSFTVVQVEVEHTTEDKVVCSEEPIVVTNELENVVVDPVDMV